MIAFAEFVVVAGALIAALCIVVLATVAEPPTCAVTSPSGGWRKPTSPPDPAMRLRGLPPKEAQMFPQLTPCSDALDDPHVAQVITDAQNLLDALETDDEPVMAECLGRSLLAYHEERLAEEGAQV